LNAHPPDFGALVTIGKMEERLPLSLGSMATWSVENYCEPFVSQGVYREVDDIVNMRVRSI
jgi:hypothetical protein